MDNTWIKLYRKARDNEIMQDPIAWILFSFILLSVDRETGSMRTGRIYLGRALRLHDSTIYKALKRLEKKYDLVTCLVTTKYTEISVSKWSAYQHAEPLGNITGNNKVTTKEQQSNTIQEERIENIENTLPDPSGTPKKVSEKQELYRSLIKYCREVQGIEKEFVNFVKQTTALKKIFMVGYSDEDIRFVIDEMGKDPYWHDNTFDLMNVANGMQKYLNRTVYFKKGGSHASTK